MNGLDVFIFLVVSFSFALGLWRGFVREGLSLSKWLIAIVLAWLFANQATTLFEGSLENPTHRLVAAFLFVFVVGYLLGSFATRALNKLLSSGSLLKLTNKLLGASFGALRGLLIVLVVFLLSGLTSIPRTAWWQDSLFTRAFNHTARPRRR